MPRRPTGPPSTPSIRDEQGLPPLTEEEQAAAVAAPREVEQAEADEAAEPAEADDAEPTEA